MRSWTGGRWPFEDGTAKLRCGRPKTVTKPRKKRTAGPGVRLNRMTVNTKEANFYTPGLRNGDRKNSWGA